MVICHWLSITINRNSCVTNCMYGICTTCMTVASPVALHRESLAHHHHLAPNLVVGALDPFLLPRSEEAMVAIMTLVGPLSYPRSLHSLRMWGTFLHKLFKVTWMPYSRTWRYKTSLGVTVYPSSMSKSQQKLFVLCSDSNILHSAKLSQTVCAVLSVMTAITFTVIYVDLS